ncbi:MAG: hypothetical protein OER82_08465 [Nitrosopumilus sp.]|nr:hypothetical protein [Nitrosopumilus sp.]
MTVDYGEMSKQILDLYPKVRFAGVVNSKGEMIAGGHKENVEKILVGDEVSMSIHYALQKRDLYTNLAYKLGHERSSITEYAIVTMINIPINSNDLFLISVEPRADYMKIIDYVYSLLDSQKDTK